MDKVKIGFPIEYEDENNIVRNGLFLREPEIKELEKRLKEINKITELEQQCKKQKEVINNAMEYIEKLLKEEIEITDETNIYYGEKLVRPAFSDDEVEKIKDILNGVSK